jgi:glycosyltransferase involved in cell wall biosynthesis
LFPTLEDTFAVVIAEALASGVPVVCSKFAGISSHLTDGEDAFVVDPNDHERVAECVIQLLRSPELRESFRNRGQILSESFDGARSASVFADAAFSVVSQGQ